MQSCHLEQLQWLPQSLSLVTVFLTDMTCDLSPQPQPPTSSHHHQTSQYYVTQCHSAGCADSVTAAADVYLWSRDSQLEADRD